MATKNILFRDLKAGMTVYNKGHIFKVENVTNKDGIVRYKGVCTPDPVNDSIRRTAYDGGNYGGRASDPVTIETGDQWEVTVYGDVNAPAVFNRTYATDADMCMAVRELNRDYPGHWVKVWSL